MEDTLDDDINDDLMVLDEPPPTFSLKSSKATVNHNVAEVRIERESLHYLSTCFSSPIIQKIADPKKALEELEHEKNTINEQLVQLMFEPVDQSNQDKKAALTAKRLECNFIDYDPSAC